MKPNRITRWTLHFTLLLTMLFALAGCGSDDDDKNDKKVFRVGLLSGSDTFNTTMDGFKAQMAEYGYVEGENITYDFQAAAGDAARMAEISEKFVEDKVDLIFLTSNNAALAARTATEGTKVPVVFTFVIAPTKTGVVESISQPGGNLTGVLNPLDVFIGKRVEFLMKMDPAAQRLWVPYNPAYPTVTAVLEELRAVMSVLDIELVETEVATPDDVPVALAAFDDAGDPTFDAIIIFPDLTVQEPVAWNAILDYANEHSLPILANTPPQVEAGALFGYFSDNVLTGKQAARLADQILKGTAAGELPVETAEQFLTVNLKVANTLDLELTDDVLRQATTVIR